MGTESRVAAEALCRIETLIPFKEPEFTPKASMGKLNLTNSIWSIAAKLGRYLLSGEEQPDLTEVSRACAAWLMGRPVDDLEALGRGDLPDSAWDSIRYSVEGAFDVFRAKGGDRLLVVAHDKARKSWLGGWKLRSSGISGRTVKLPAALGMMEIFSMCEEPGGLGDALAEQAVKDWLAEAEAFRGRFRSLEEKGLVQRAEPGRHYFFDRHRIMVEGTEEEVRAELEKAAWKASQIEIMGEVERLLAEGKYADRGPLPSLLRSYAVERWDEEGCREANRRYARSGHCAGVFEDKKGCDLDHRAAAQAGYLAKSFRHVEVDDDVDLGEYARLTREFEARDRAGELPRVTKADHALRFRKCGRHRAIGVYSPLFRAVAVDPRAPRSLLHEFAHAYDFEHGQMSTSLSFKPILRAFCAEFRPGEMSAAKIDYYTTPTEVFARSWEAYAATHGIGGSFVAPIETYMEDPAYRPLLDHAADLEAYFEDFARPIGIARVADAQERAVETLREGDGREFEELRRQVAAGEVDAFRLREDLGAGMGLGEREKARMGELMAASLLSPTALAAVPETAEPAVDSGREPAVPGFGEQMALF